MIIPANPGFNQIVEVSEGRYYRIPIIAWFLKTNDTGETIKAEYITADMENEGVIAGLEYPSGVVEDASGTAYRSFDAFKARSSMTARARNAIAFVRLVKGETASRDYGVGLDQVIELLSEL